MQALGRVRKNFGGDLAAIFLSHGQATEDTLLEEYAARFFAPMWKATNAYGRWLRKVWNVKDPFPAKTQGVRTVLPLKTIRRIEELASQGYVPSKIAEMTGVSESTCKRHARRAKKNAAEPPTV
jgi:hypothetical protein